jgi:dipeptidase E
MPTTTDKQLLLISNSTQHGSGYLDHAESEIRDLVGRKTQVLFIPFALRDRRAYTAKIEARLREMGLSVQSVHDTSNMARAVREAEVIFAGGGNTFRLLKGLYDHELTEPIRRAIAEGALYIGSSAGSIVAGPSIKTTKDMPIVQPQSFEALDLVPFQISPHYLDPDPSSIHMGETQEERITQFLEENDAPVVGLREGSMLRLQDGAVHLKGPHGARIFRRDREPIEVKSGADLYQFLVEATSAVGRVA